MWQHCHHDYSTWDSGVNSPLVYSNNMFDVLRKGREVYLAHITGTLDGIVEGGAIYPSAGCLVGSIYCTPAFKIAPSGQLKLHNLGSYYYLKEIPIALKKPPALNKSPQILIIKITRDSENGYSVEGVNYLRMGHIHYELFDDDQGLHLLRAAERNRVKRKLLDAVRTQEAFLLDTIDKYTHSTLSTKHNLEYLEAASHAVSSIPYFGYVLFEAFSVCLMLYQNDERSIRSRHGREFNNWNYKEIMYELYPDFSSNFRLSKFGPDWEKILELTEKRGAFEDVNADHFINAVAARARKYICDNSFDNHHYFYNERRKARGPLTWDWAAQNISPLLGHMAHRELRNSEEERREELFRLFETEKARKIWMYWNKKGILFPFNAVIPKGEIGINPCFEKAKLEFYAADVSKVENDDVYVSLGKKLDIKMKPQLGELRHTLRRNVSETIDNI